MKEIEIERKFLLDRKGVESYLRRLPYYSVKKLEIEQFYVSITEDAEIRVRKTESEDGITYVKTIKKGSGLSREENEFEISIEDFYSYSQSSSISVNKTRYVVADLEFDLYPTGLAILEKEYDSEEEANNDEFIFEFIVKEVTDDSFYKNAEIAKRG